MAEHRGETRVPAFSEAAHLAGGLGLARVVIHVEMFGRENREIELLVLDLVATEVLGVCGGDELESEDERGEDRGSGQSATMVAVALHRKRAPLRNAWET